MATVTFVTLILPGTGRGTGRRPVEGLAQISQLFVTPAKAGVSLRLSPGSS